MLNIERQKELDPGVSITHEATSKLISSKIQFFAFYFTVILLKINYCHVIASDYDLNEEKQCFVFRYVSIKVIIHSLDSCNSFQCSYLK